MFRHRILVAGLICGLAATLHACYSPTQASYPPSSTSKVSVNGVKVTPQAIQFSAVGETAKLTATVTPSNATDLAVTWESSDSSIATVDGTGLVTAKAVGSGVFITAFTHDGRYQASAVVNVNQ